MRVLAENGLLTTRKAAEIPGLVLLMRQPKEYKDSSKVWEETQKEGEGVSFSICLVDYEALMLVRRIQVYPLGLSLSVSILHFKVCFPLLFKLVDEKISFLT